MPRLRNLLTEPVARLLEDGPHQGVKRKALVAVDGLACALCAARVQRALYRVPNVIKVDFSPQKDHFTVYYRSGQSQGRILAEAASSTVVAPRLRRLIGRRTRGLPLAKPGP